MESLFVHKMVNLEKELFNIAVIKNRILVGFETGDTELFQWQDNELNSLYTNKDSEHERKITGFISLFFFKNILGIDVNEELEMFITTAEDGIVKIWNWDKVLLREIKFAENIGAGLILNNECDLIIAHQNKVSIVRASTYKPFHKTKAQLRIESPESKL